MHDLVEEVGKRNQSKRDCLDEAMRAGRKKRRKGVAEKDWASGPGRVCAALGIEMHHNRHEGKIGILCAAQREGLGVTNPELRQRIGEERLSIFRRHDAE